MVKCDIPKYRLENWKIRYNFLYVNSESGVVIFTNSASFALCLPQLKVRFDVGIFASRSPVLATCFLSALVYLAI